jgi:hypothetical protein
MIKTSERFTVSRFVIQDYIVLFTDMNSHELKVHIAGLSGTHSLSVYPHSFNLLEQRLGIYTAVYQGFLITNILTQYDTIAYH